MIIAGVFVFVIKYMSKNRYINTKFWDDTYVMELDPVEKLLFLYFLTNPLTNISGMYEISLRRTAFDTGIDSDMISKILERFEKDNKILYRENWICITNFIKNQSLNPSVIAGIEREVKLVPSKIRKQFVTACDSLTQEGTLNLIKSNYIKPNKTAFFRGDQMRYKKGEKKWYVIVDGEWKEFVGSEKDIEWK